MREGMPCQYRGTKLFSKGSGQLAVCLMSWHLRGSDVGDELPIANLVTQDVVCLVADLHLGTVTDEFGGAPCV